MIPFSEHAPDRADFGNPGTVAKNAVFVAGHWRPLNTTATITNALSGRAYAAVGGVDSSGTAEMFTATVDRLWRRSGVSWEDVSRGGLAYTTASDKSWQMVQSGKYIIATNFGDQLQYTTLGAAAAFANVSSTDVPKARRVGQLLHHLVVGDTTDAADGHVPHRVWWPEIRNPLSWPTRGSSDAAAKQSDFQNLEQSDGKVTAIRGAEYGVVFQERAVTRMTYVGSPRIYQFDRIDRNRGCIAPNAAVEVGRRVFFPSHDGFFVTDGTGESQPIGRGRVDLFFLGNLDTAKLEFLVAGHDRERKLIYWSFPRSGSGFDYATETLVYNYEYDKWSYADALKVEVYAESIVPGFTLEGMDVLGNVDAQTVTWDSPIYKGGQRSFALVNEAHKLGTLGGTPGTATFVTGDFNQKDGSRSLLYGVRPVLESGTPSVRVGTRAKHGDSISWSPYRSPQADTGYSDFRASGMFHRIEVQVAGDFVKGTGVDVMSRRDGMR